MATAGAIIWLLAAFTAQCTSSIWPDEGKSTENPKPSTLIGEGKNTEYPNPMRMIDEPDKEQQRFIENFEDTNPTKVGNKELFEADILLTEEQMEAHLTRKALNYSQYRWTEGSDGYPFIPYVFQDSIDKDDVRAAINHWMENTCLKFGLTTNTSQPHIQFHIGRGCWSYIGMLYFRNGQQISIGRGCNSLGIIAHEIGHAIGFYHEQSRSDRDNYIIINTNNIYSGREGNFRNASTNNYNITYDYSSNMHYSSRGFSKNGGLTIATIDPLEQELIGTRSGLSHRDILMANTMYGCLDKWLSKCKLSSNPCKNEGYIGAKCKCICPTHTSGNNCQKRHDSYYAHLRSNKTQILTKKGTISINIKGGDKFTKLIIAPKCKIPKLTFNTFNLYNKSKFSNGASFCYYEFLNIRTGDDLYDGDIFCGTEISSGKTFKSSTRQMILYTESRYYGSSAFSAKLTFEDDSSCGGSSTTMSSTPTMTPTTTTPGSKYQKCKNRKALMCKKKKAITKVKIGETVTFKSPNFPDDYPKRASCGWILKLKDSSAGKFLIKCNGILFQKNYYGNCQDVLKINGKDLGKTFCGRHGQINQTIKTNKNNRLYIHFKSNGKKEYKGFCCTATAKSSKSNNLHFGYAKTI